MHKAEVREIPNPKPQIPSSKRFRHALIVVAVLLVSGIAHAQGDARFSGTVLDPSGAAVPNAPVVVKNEKTGEERTVTSNK